MSNDDETLVLKYLSGFKRTDTKGRTSTEYLKPRDSQELKARAALTKLLLSVEAVSQFDPLSFKIRQELASLFAPDGELPAGHRTVELRHRRRDKAIELDSTLAIGEFLWNRTALRGDCECGKDPVKFESAVKEAEERLRCEAESCIICMAALPQTGHAEGVSNVTRLVQLN
jgi:hypothetical protein